MAFSSEHLLSLTPGTDAYSAVLQRYRDAAASGNMDALLALYSLAQSDAAANYDDDNYDNQFFDVFNSYHRAAYKTPGVSHYVNFGTAVHSKYRNLREEHADMSAAEHSCLEHNLGNGLRHLRSAVEAGTAAATPLLHELTELSAWHRQQHVADHFRISARDAALVSDFTAIWNALQTNGSQDDWAAARHAVQRWAAASNLAALETLGTYLTRQLPGLVITSPGGVLLSQLMDCLAAHEEIDAIALAFRLLRRYESANQWHELRTYAQTLAEYRPMAEMTALLTRDSSAYCEAWAVLLHDYIIRGCFDHTDDTATEFLAALRAGRHPLGVLPSHLTPCESLLLTDYADLPADTASVKSDSATSFGQSRPDASPATRWTMTSALRSFNPSGYGHGNATVLAQTYTFAEPHSRATVHADSVNAFPFPPFQADRLTLSAISLPHVCRSLFVTAVGGGVYDRGQGRAYGRLAMWQSVASLAGVAMTSLDDVAEAAQECTWWSFRSDWFSGIDRLGLIVMRPDGRSLAVLAANDYD